MRLPSAPRRARRGLGLAVTLGLAGLSVAAATVARPRPLPATVADGLTFTYRVTSGQPAQKGQPSRAMLATVRMLGPNARLDYRENAMPLAKDGGYILIRGREQTFSIVNVKDRQVMVMDAEGLGSAFGALTNNALVKFAIKDPSFTFEELGAGERILGYPTRRVKVRWAQTSEMRVLFSTQRSREESEAEYWIAMNPAGVDPEGMRAWASGFGMGLQRTNRDMMGMMADYQQKFGSGIALRSVMVVRSTDLKKNVTTVDTIRSEVEELKKGALDPSLFEIPAGFEVADMRALAAGAAQASQAASDSVRVAADSAKKGDEKDSGKETAKKALRGLLRRP